MRSFRGPAAAVKGAIALSATPATNPIIIAFMSNLPYSAAPSRSRLPTVNPGDNLTWCVSYAAILPDC